MKELTLRVGEKKRLAMYGILPGGEAQRSCDGEFVVLGAPVNSAVQVTMDGVITGVDVGDTDVQVRINDIGRIGVPVRVLPNPNCPYDHFEFTLEDPA